MDLGFAGKSVLITGGGSNIGRGIVLAFAAEGARITLGDIDRDQAEATAKLARERHGARIEVVRADVTSFEDVERLVVHVRFLVRVESNKRQQYSLHVKGSQ